MAGLRLTTVLCVLKAGGEYRSKHAGRLYDQFLRHAPVDCDFVCLTDMVREVEELNVPAAPLTHGWPGWWSKLEIFAMPGPCLYCDLDVSIVGDLAPLLAVARDTTLCVCQSFWVPGEHHKINSSVMAWSGDVSHVYESFAAAPQAHMDVYKQREKWGDQAFIADFSGGWETWQDRCPGMVMSFKRGVLMGEDWTDARVVVSHGRPRPWEAGGADMQLKRR
jgi:hypothetical protein